METTNFFSSISALNITGNLQLTIRQGNDNNLNVAVMLNNDGCGDNAKKLIPPLVLNGTAEELNNGFFESINTPLQKTSELLINMDVYLKQLEEAKCQSAMEKDKADKEKKDKEEKDKKFKDAMLKVDELEKQGKFKEAWMKVPDARGFPEQAGTIRKRKSSLASKFSPDLFATSATTDEEQQQETFSDETSGDETIPEEAGSDWDNEDDSDN